MNFLGCTTPPEEPEAATLLLMLRARRVGQPSIGALVFSEGLRGVVQLMVSHV